ncbi:hypothetical protein INT48_006457 [Thamnidium elegans]|uniref:Uncharacterized protein n=1 Tax=Thamnidium elegans TaxID=101142 RepID=A0A8H7SPR7_9FUNG|nr:hypothetical protein INT48_006457 [Thamnidium elegans]
MFNEENSIQALEKFEALSDEHEVCYLTDPAIPVLVLKTRLYGNTFLFKEYFNEVKKLETKAQVLKFINEVYSIEPVFDDMYTLRTVSLSDVFGKVLQYSTYFNRKTLNAFSSFCGKNKLIFMTDGLSQKRSKDKVGSYIRYWDLYVLQDKYQVNVLNNILEYNEKYEGFLKTQKELGLEIIGYARKSFSDKNEENSTKLLRMMVEKLRSQSLVDKVFVSKTSAANQPFHKRDINQDNIEGTDGCTTEVILVVLDYAGLTTNVEDLKEFLRLPITYEVEIYETEMLLQDQNAIKKFDCRTRPIQRSL